MSVRQVLRATTLGLALSLAGTAGFAPQLMAQEPQAAVERAGSIRQALEQQLGKRAKLKLVSGQDLEGKVAEVGSEVVTIEELTGMEFFGATVRLDQVAAVIVRTR